MKTAIVLTTVLLLSFAPASAQSPGDVYLSDVDGLTTGKILVESSGTADLKFTLNFRNNDWANKARGLSNGFRFYGSDSSVTWALTYGWHPSIPVNCFDYPWFDPTGDHGVGADTIDFSVGPPCFAGLPAGFDGPVLNFWVQMADTASAGGTLCLDSAFFPPSGSWMWSFGGAGTSMPTWDGPHCWPVIGTCCQGMCGNIDGDSEDQLDISDLVYLTDYMFTGGPVPPCWDEADVDGSGGSVIDISDLVRIVGYMFEGESPPADCP